MKSARRTMTAMACSLLAALPVLIVTPGLATAAPTSPPSNVENVCDQNIAPGQHRCFAERRTDIKQPSVSTPHAMTNGFGPADLKSAYVLPAGTTSAVVATVVAYDYPTAEADLAVYRSQYGLPPCTTANGCFVKVNQNGATAPLPSPDAGWAQEAALDLDMISAICPTCKILLVESNDSGDSLFSGVKRATTMGAKFISMSWGGNQSPVDNSYYDVNFFSSLGVAYVAASGDSAYQDGVEYPSASPNVVSVGGTSLIKDQSTPRGWTERVWYSAVTPNGPAGTGSGCSTNSHPKPAWQFNTGCANRAVNDVSAIGDPQTGVNVYTASGWGVFGGTSASAPIIAAVYALVGASPSPKDNPATSLYVHPGNFNDVTVGSNGVCSPAVLCTAGPGWDGPTGLGTPNGIGGFKNSNGIDPPWTIRTSTTGAIEDFATAGDQQIYHRYMTNGTFTAWSSLGGLPGGVPLKSTQVSWGINYVGNPELYVTGLDGNVYHDFATPGVGSGWSGWGSLSQPPVGAASDVQIGRNYLNNQEMYVVGTDANVYHKFSTPGQGSGWSEWDTLGGPPGTTTAFGIHVGRNDANNQELYVVGKNGVLYHDFATPGRGNGWHGWDPMASVPGVGFRGDVNVGINSLGNQELYFVGTDGQVYHNFATPGHGTGWASFSSLGSPGVPITGTIDLEAFDYRLLSFQDLLVYGADGTVFENDSTPGQGSGWSGWQ